MTPIPNPLAFAMFGATVALVLMVLCVGVTVGWLIRLALKGWRAFKASEFGWRVWAHAAGVPRYLSPSPVPTRIPAAPKPFPPLPSHMADDDSIRAELARIEAALLEELGPTFAQILSLFADDPHTTDHRLP